MEHCNLVPVAERLRNVSTQVVSIHTGRNRSRNRKQNHCCNVSQRFRQFPSQMVKDVKRHKHDLIQIPNVWWQTSFKIVVGQFNIVNVLSILSAAESKPSAGIRAGKPSMIVVPILSASRVIQRRESYREEKEKKEKEKKKKENLRAPKAE